MTPAGTARLRIHSGDPSPLLEAAFRRIESERMAGVPVLNPALRVEALGFSRWQGHWLGILITPWFMNLVLVPGREEGWQSVADGERLFRSFPAGDYAFLGGCEPEVGEFQTCALFSPMDRFADQDSAGAVAAAALQLLCAAPARIAASEAERERAWPADSARPAQEGWHQPMSKRRFLRLRTGP